MCSLTRDHELTADTELNEYRYKVANGTRLNGTTAKLRCRLCSSAQVDELECEGMCGEWKPLSEFSKAQRTRGEKVRNSSGDSCGKLLTVTVV